MNWLPDCYYSVSWHYYQYFLTVFGGGWGVSCYFLFFSVTNFARLFHMMLPEGTGLWNKGLFSFSSSYLLSTWQPKTPRHSGRVAHSCLHTDCAALALNKKHTWGRETTLHPWTASVAVAIQIKSASTCSIHCMVLKWWVILWPTVVSVVSTMADSCSTAVSKLVPEGTQLMRSLHSSTRRQANVLHILQTQGNWVQRS